MAEGSAWSVACGGLDQALGSVRRGAIARCVIASVALAIASSLAAIADEPKPAAPPAAKPEATPNAPVAKPIAKPAASVPQKAPTKPNAEPAKPADAPSPPEAGAPAMPEAVDGRDLDLRFDVPSTIVDAPRSHMLPVRMGQNATTAVVVLARSSDESVLRVIREPEFLVGFDLAFVRVRAVRPGEAVLSVGGATQTIRVVEDRGAGVGAAAGQASGVWARLQTPRVVVPMDGAGVWGKVGVGVTWLDDPQGPLQGITLTLRPESIATETSGEALSFSPVTITDLEMGPTRTAAFVLDTDKLAPGVWSLVAQGRTAEGREIIGGQTRVRLLGSAGESVQSVVAAELRENERPERFKRGKIVTGLDARAFEGKGGRVVINNSADPPVSWNLKVETAGFYQMFIVAAGDFGVGAFPSVSVVVDGGAQPMTAGQLIASGWQRVPLGVPVKLEAGDRMVSPRFENDIAAGNLGDRNVRIERLELRRVGGATAGGESPGAMAAGGGEMMNAGGAMMGKGDSPAMQGEGGMMSEAAGKGTPDAKPDAKPEGGDAMTMMGGESGGSKDAFLQPLDRSDPLLLQDDDQLGTGFRMFRVAWLTQFDGREPAGVIELEAQCSWEASDRVPAPLSRLLVNGVEVARQRSARPRFWLRPSMLNAGENSVQIIAQAHNGLIARTLSQTLIGSEGQSAAPGEKPSASMSRAFWRFTMHEPSWDKTFVDVVRLNGEAREQRRAGLFSGVAYTLRLPAAMNGPYRVLLEARGATAKGLPKVVLAIRSDDGATTDASVREIGTVQLRGGLAVLDVGQIELSPGSKRLILRSDHKGYEQSSGEPGVNFESVIFEPVSTGGAAAASAELIYPSEAGREAFGVESLVARVRGDVTVDRVDVLVDGAIPPGGAGVQWSRGVGPVYVTLPLRDIAPGQRAIALRLTDTSGKTFDTNATNITVVSEAPATPTRYQRAVRVATRFGHGPDAATMTRALTMEPREFVRRSISDAARSERLSVAAGVSQFKIHRNEGENAQRVIAQHAITQNAPGARFNAWIQNHFTTWLRKIEPDRAWQEYARVASQGNAPFDQLLLGSATSPAMMLYLDQTQSYRGRLNENYAREIMELHSLGVNAGYTQADVTAMARLLTGWIAARQAESEGRNDRDVRESEFRFDPRLNDDRPQTVFGVRFNNATTLERFDRALSAIEMLARHPKTARFISEQIVESYVEAPAPAELVDQVARVFQSSGGDLAECLGELAELVSTRSDAQRRLTHPLDYSARLMRAQGQRPGGSLPGSGAANGFLRRCRAGVFDCPTPDGYAPEDTAWADSNGMIQRFKFAREQAAGIAALVPSSVRDALNAKGVTPEARRALEQRAIDAIAIALTGELLTERSSEAVWKVVEALPEKTSPTDRLRECAAMIAAMPETNLR
jgi:uncharacterized protein (DUF1800 family)